MKTGDKKDYFRVSRLGTILPGTGNGLYHLDIELTERCNNNCIHCYINQAENDEKIRKKELSTEEWKAVIQEAADLGCMTIRFTGGEPLLRDDFEEIYVFTRKLGIKVILFTNATLITPGHTELFSCIPPLDRIEITLYGMQRNSYEGVSRTPGSFEKALHGIELLKEKKIPFEVRGALLPANRHEIDAFEEWGGQVSWKNRKPSQAIFFDFRGRRDSDQKNRIINGLRLDPEECLAYLTRRGEDYIREGKELCGRFSAEPGPELFGCGAGTGRASVDAYGFLQSCLLVRHPKTVYDLKYGSIRKAMESFLPKFRKMKAKNPDYLARCARCFLRGFCDQCPAKSWMEHGTLDTPVEYYCRIAHAQARYLGIVREGENAWEIENGAERKQWLIEAA